MKTSENERRTDSVGFEKMALILTTVSTLHMPWLKVNVKLAEDLT